MGDKWLENICTEFTTSLPLFLALISLGFITAPPALAGTVSPLPYTVENAPVIIEAYAVRYGTESTQLKRTLQCESGFDSSAVGDRGSSFGVAQIHLPAHRDITKAEALDPFFSIDWAAREFSLGHQNLWSCYKILYGGTSP